MLCIQFSRKETWILKKNRILKVNWEEMENIAGALNKSDFWYFPWNIQIFFKETKNKN